MLKYVFKRLLVLIPFLAGAMFIVFMVLYLFGNPDPFGMGQDFTPEAIDRWREARGLNDPVLIQYARYMSGILTGNFGNSFRNNAPITSEVTQRLPHTLQLGFAALSAALILALPMGIIAAVKRNTWIDRLIMFIALIGISIPIFWLGLLLALFFSLRLGWFPSSGMSEWNSIFLPGIALGTAMMAAMIRSTRSAVLEAVKQDYIRTARAKGLSNSKIIRKHALSNIIIPVLTSFKANLGVFFTGILVVETIFAWPGIGRLMIQGIAAQDYPMILGCLFMFILSFALINLVIDIAKAFADPRIKEQYRQC